jgi:hypothetical protein
MGSYVDTTVTLTSSVLKFQYLFPAGQHKHPVWVGIANQSQGTLSVQFYSNTGAGEGPTNIDAGQPFVSQEEFYMMTVTGVAGQVFNVKIQDEKLDLGKKQIVSSSTQTLLSTSVAVASSLTQIYVVPVGVRAQLLSAIFTNTSSSSSTFSLYDLYQLTVGDYGEAYTPPGGVSVAGNGLWTLGASSANTAVLESPAYLMPGEVLAAQDSIGAGTITVRFLITPL